MSTLLKKLAAGVAATGLTAAAATAGGPVYHTSGAAVHPAGAVAHTGGQAYHPGGTAVHTGGSVVHTGSPAYHTGGAVIHTGGAYHLTHGRAFAGGYCYPGKNHTHWTYSGYSAKYGCTCYWCPSTRQYYYWCQTADCYYPVTYITSAPPVQVAQVPVVVRTVLVAVLAPAGCQPPCPAPAPNYTPYPAPAPGYTPAPYAAGGQPQDQGPPAGVSPLPQ